jgi:Mrp family chromosome partitioning ATPase
LSDEEEPNIVASSVAGLYLLYAGKYPENPTRLISSERMADLFRYCKKHFDYIILDTPALDAGSEALLLKKHINGYVVVAKSPNSDVDSLGNAMESLRSLDATIFGMVLMGEKVKK